MFAFLQSSSTSLSILCAVHSPAFAGGARRTLARAAAASRGQRFMSSMFPFTSQQQPPAQPGAACFQPDTDGVVNTSPTPFGLTSRRINTSIPVTSASVATQLSPVALSSTTAQAPASTTASATASSPAPKWANATQPGPPSPTLAAATPSPQSSQRASKLYLSVQSKTHETDTIVFDMNGTLFDNSNQIRSWAGVMAEKMAAECDDKAVARMFDAVGYDPVAQRARGDGMLAMRPWQEVYDTVAYELCRSCGLTYPTASDIISSWRGDVDHFTGYTPLVALEPFLEEMRAVGMRRFALSTSDDRAVAMSLLRDHNIDHFFNVVVAGTDDISPKPQPDHLRYILMALERAPNRAIMVGDTNADMMLARNSDVGLGVGVLSGWGTMEQMQLYTDVFVDTVEGLRVLLSGQMDSDELKILA